MIGVFRRQRAWLKYVRSILNCLLIASGGINNGLEAAKAIHLGANLVGQAGAVLKAATISTQLVVDHFEQMALELRLACFGTGSAKVNALTKARRL